jgi:5-methyltetrahydrofolate--homocysteine methyltransferase
LHEKVRRLWYAPDEQLSNDLLIAEDFRGIRPAFGYPTCPDHTEKSKLWQLLQADDVGIHLTETLSMVPAASVSGLYMAHPGARYFNLGPVGGEQLVDYARRKGTSIQEVERALQGTIAEL